MTHTYEQLSRFVKAVFESLDMPQEEAAQATRVLLEADVRGIDSHGIARLSGYVRLWKKGRINAAAKPFIAHETVSTATLDGDAGFGLLVGQLAMQKAIEKARACGTGWVAVKNSNHFGIAASHAMLALKEDMIGIAMTNASPLVTPTFSVERMLGTNPMCFAIPTGEESPFVADLATSAAANGKIELAERGALPLPEGWVQDPTGNPSVRPDELRNGGSLLPLGSDRMRGSHKGYALAATVDIFSAVLSGANYGPWVPPFVAFLDPLEPAVGTGIGHFFGAMCIGAFRPAAEFKHHMDNWIRTFKNAKPLSENQPVLIPGEPEAQLTKVRLEKGIPIPPSLEATLAELAFERQVPWP